MRIGYVRNAHIQARRLFLCVSRFWFLHRKNMRICNLEVTRICTWVQLCSSNSRWTFRVQNHSSVQVFILLPWSCSFTTSRSLSLFSKRYSEVEAKTKVRYKIWTNLFVLITLLLAPSWRHFVSVVEVSECLSHQLMPQDLNSSENVLASLTYQFVLCSPISPIRMVSFRLSREWECLGFQMTIIWAK